MKLETAMNIKKAVEEAKEEQAKKESWKKDAEEALKDVGAASIKREDVSSLAAKVAKGGFPKNLTFLGVRVHIDDEKDYSKFWATVFSNLTKEKIAEVKEKNVADLTESDVYYALLRVYNHTSVADRLIKAGIAEGAIEFTVEGEEYILAAGMATDLSGNVVADVSDVDDPYGPDEWAKIISRIIDARHGYEEEDHEEEEY